jgi:hypothetical protein
MDFNTIQTDAKEIISALKLLKLSLLQDDRIKVNPDSLNIHLLGAFPCLSDGNGFQVFFDRHSQLYHIAIKSHSISFGYFKLETAIEILVVNRGAQKLDDNSVEFIMLPETEQKCESYEEILNNFIHND